MKMNLFMWIQKHIPQSWKKINMWTTCVTTVSSPFTLNTGVFSLHILSRLH